MKVYKSSDKFGITSYFDSYIDVLEEFKAFLDNGIELDMMSYEILEMTEEEYKELSN